MRKDFDDEKVPRPAPGDDAVVGVTRGGGAGYGATAREAAALAASMTQEERRAWLIRALAAERDDLPGQTLEPPDDPQGQRRLLRALLNVRPPWPADQRLLAVQDAYLRARLAERGGAVRADALPRTADGLALWRGDITLLEVDAIVNAANSGLLGCFAPNHGCIDNAIHTFAGIQLRLECASLVGARGGDEPAGRARITAGHNLPAAHVLHTVGPIVAGDGPTRRDEELLASCYGACLDLAAARGLRSVAFCCISTGEFRFPNALAARVAVDTVRGWLRRNPSDVEVTFDVFKPVDERLYRELLAGD